MKYRILFLLLFIATVSQAQQTPLTVSGRDGIFVWCGHPFAKGFEYLVYINQAKGWKLLSTLKFPANLSEFNARINETSPLYPYLTVPAENELSRIWEKAQRTQLIDSVTPYLANPLIVESLGAGILVTGIEKGKDYSFKVVKSYSKSHADTLSLIRNIRFPGEKLQTIFKPYKVNPQGKSVTVEFEITKPDRMFDCDVYRSSYLRNDFEKISVSKLYYKKSGKSYISLSDESVVTGAGYTYYLVPFDAMGNSGPASETVNLYNTQTDKLSVIFEKFKGKSVEKENAIKLSWKLSSTKSLVSVDIYRSESYDGNYQKIISLSPADTVYFDKTVKPVSAYFYTIRLNGDYQKSFPSARIPVILKPNRPNIFPPKNLTVSHTGNLVRLSWQKFEDDTRGYYVYRAEGFRGEPKQISAIILSDSAKVGYTDTLKVSDGIQTYTYSVADVNTSYAISQLSESVPVQVVTSVMPVPTRIRTIFRNDKILILWDDMQKSYPFVIGYRVTRRADSFENKPVEKSKTISVMRSNRNYLEDSAVIDNMKYYYTVQCLGIDSAKSGSQSQEVACFIYETLIPMPSNLRLFPQGKSIIIQWDEPIFEAIVGYKIYRSEKDQEPVEIANIKPGIVEYVDQNVKKGKSYFYSIESVAKNDRVSKRTEYVGITFNP